MNLWNAQLNLAFQSPGSSLKRSRNCWLTKESCSLLKPQKSQSLTISCRKLRTWSTTSKSVHLTTKKYRNKFKRKNKNERMSKKKNLKLHNSRTCNILERTRSPHRGQLVSLVRHHTLACFIRLPNSNCIKGNRFTSLET
eukprot:PhF_6_TR7895/c0_g1_i1/m.11635